MAQGVGVAKSEKNAFKNLLLTHNGYGHAGALKYLKSSVEKNMLHDAKFLQYTKFASHPNLL
jgi:hypothetical protein